MADWDTDFIKGQRGVSVVVLTLQQLGYHVQSLQENQTLWHRGDLYVSGIGFVEVKTDYTDYDNVYLEIDVAGKPGWVYASRADYVLVYFVKKGLMYLFPMPDIQRFVAEHYLVLRPKIRTATTYKDGSKWQSSGIPVAIEILCEAIPQTKKWEVLDDEDLLGRANEQLA